MLVIILGFLAFLDMILIFVQLLIVSSNNNQADSLSNLMRAIRLILALVFPNITVKRGMYNLKILNNSYCSENANTVLAGTLKFEYFLIETLYFINVFPLKKKNHT